MLIIAGCFQIFFLGFGSFLDLVIFRPEGKSLREDAREYFLGKDTLRHYLYGVLFIIFGGLLINIWQAVWQRQNTPLIFDLSKLGIFWKWFALLLLSDFCYYLDHLFTHKINLLWSGHKFHHGAKRFSSVFVTLRLSPEIAFYLFPAFLPLFFGYTIIETVLMANIVMSYGFMLHSERIPKLHRFYESIFMTPSLHRVHHGTQERYLDKNFGFVFSFWDTLFRTREEEKENPVLGVLDYRERKKILSQYFCGYIDLCEDWMAQNKIMNRIKLLFSAPGAVKK